MVPNTPGHQSEIIWWFHGYLLKVFLHTLQRENDINEVKPVTFNLKSAMLELALFHDKLRRKVFKNEIDNVNCDNLLMEKDDIDQFFLCPRLFTCCIWKYVKVFLFCFFYYCCYFLEHSICYAHANHIKLDTDYKWLQGWGKHICKVLVFVLGFFFQAEMR